MNNGTPRPDVNFVTVIDAGADQRSTHATAAARTCDAQPSTDAPLTPTAVAPMFQHHRFSMSVEQSARLLKHPEAKTAGAIYLEALAVKSRGRHYVAL